MSMLLRTRHRLKDRDFCATTSTEYTAHDDAAGVESLPLRGPASGTLLSAESGFDKRVLALLVLVAFALRMAGIDWGGYVGDEHLGYSVKVLTGQLTPDDLFYPPLLHYLNAVALLFLFVSGVWLGIWHSTADFQAQYFSDPTSFWIATRAVTAVFGALQSLLAVMIARRMRVPRLGALLVGVVVALLPVSVWMSHVSKTDIAMATAVMLTIWSFLRALDVPSAKSNGLGIGFSVALAVSFKQSALFLIAPLGVGFLILQWNERSRSPKSLLTMIAIALATCVVTWIPMNIGLVLDWDKFLEYQRLQATLSLRPFNAQTLVTVVAPHLADLYKGATIVLFSLFLVTPLVDRQPRSLWLWGSVLFGVLITAYCAGDRVTLPLYTPPAIVIGLAGMTTIAGGLSSRVPWRRIVFGVGAVCALVLTGYGAVQVVRQATSPSVADILAERLDEIAEKETARILVPRLEVVPLPLSRDAIVDAHERHERLGQKYGIEIPEMHPGRLQASGESGYYLCAMPWALDGLEEYRPEEKDLLKPYCWPVQEEEWDLEYWTERGFTVFVVSDQYNHDVPAYCRLHKQIEESCELVAVVEIDRPLFAFGASAYRIYSSAVPSTQRPKQNDQQLTCVERTKTIAAGER